MKYAGIMPCSISDGHGCRVVLFCSGCTIHCDECHNPLEQNPEYGKEFTEKTYETLYNLLNHDYIEGLTISGGHPLEEFNKYKILDIIHWFKSKFPNKSIWLYTGLDLTIDDWDGPYGGILRLCDRIVDGHYDKTQRNITIPYRGSENQRIIDGIKTFACGEIVDVSVKYDN